jgi:hypothetical protein
MSGDKTKSENGRDFEEAERGDMGTENRMGSA